MNVDRLETKMHKNYGGEMGILSWHYSERWEQQIWKKVPCISQHFVESV